MLEDDYALNIAEWNIDVMCWKQEISDAIPNTWYKNAKP